MTQISEQELKTILIEKLDQCGGEAYVPMLRRGNFMHIRLSENKDGIEKLGTPRIVCTFHELHAVYQKIIELGGKMYLGANEAHAGHRIGSEKFPIDMMAAFIAIEFYGQKIGETTRRLSTYYSAILDWAGVATKHRGGFIIVP